MGLSPKTRRRLSRRARLAGPVGFDAGVESPRSEAVAKVSADRIKRPIPERTGPLRRATELIKEEASDGGLASGGSAPTTPAEGAVATAYQVFEKYLEEGRQFAEGQSAWYPEDESRSELNRNLARSLADFLGVVGRAANTLGLEAPRTPVARAGVLTSGPWQEVSLDSSAAGPGAAPADADDSGEISLEEIALPAEETRSDSS